MNNRQYNGQYFNSEYLHLETIRKNENIQEEDFVDFYIFLDKEIHGKKNLVFHVNYSFIEEYINAYQYSYSGREIPHMEKIIHQELLDCLTDDEKSIEDCYRMFVEYLCFGMRFRYAINNFTDMNFGVMATFDSDFTLKEKLVITPAINQSYHCPIIEK